MTNHREDETETQDANFNFMVEVAGRTCLGR